MKSLILGYGNTGQSVKKYFDTTSKDYLIHDDNLDLLKDIGEELVFRDSHLDQVDQIVVSPGIKPDHKLLKDCLLYTSPSPRDPSISRMPSSA